MYALRVGFIVASCAVGVTIAQGRYASQEEASASTAYEQLTTLAKRAGASPTVETLRQTADILTQTSSATDLSPQGLPSDLQKALADILVDAQSAWLSDKSARSIEVKALADELNRQLDLDEAPEYMRARPEQLTRIRVRMWWLAPEFMVSSPQRKGLSPGVRVADRGMSPFEAFLVADTLFHQKLVNDDYLRTQGEVDEFQIYPSERRRPGWHRLPNSARRDAFQSHLDRVAKTKWNGAQGILDSVRSVLEVGHVK